MLIQVRTTPINTNFVQIDASIADSFKETVEKFYSDLDVLTK